MIKILRTYDNKILNSQKYVVKYGRLYNFPAVAYSAGGASIAPVGWHIPTNAECLALDTEILNNGYKLKETGTTFWNDPNNGTNEYGFNARGSGEAGISGGFINLKIGFAIWTSTSHANPQYAYCASITNEVNDFATDNVADKRKGLSIRLIKNDSTDPGTMTDIDGNVYPTVKIGNQVWMAANLCVTHYNDGTPIPEITNGTEWVENTTGARCSYNNIESNAGYYSGVKAILRRFIEDFVNKYGLLYNFYAISDSRKITSSDDWTIPTYSQQTALFTYLGGASVAGNKLRETGTLHWTSPNSGATNEVGFTARGAGQRPSIFNSILNRMYFWSATPDSTNAYGAIIEYNNAGIVPFLLPKYYGHSVRLVKDATGVSDGTTIEYVGNDLKKYTAIAINQLYWTENIAETKFRTGVIIPWYGSNIADFFTNSEWSSLSTAGCAAYNNDVANVGVGFSFPA